NPLDKGAIASSQIRHVNNQVLYVDGAVKNLIRDNWAHEVSAGGIDHRNQVLCAIQRETCGNLYSAVGRTIFRQRRSIRSRLEDARCSCTRYVGNEEKEMQQ